ncbi:MAG: hypothetical protein PVS2B1_01670 [Candidatus Dormibacteraceae bacterium]
MFFAGLVTAFLGAIFVLLVFETWALFTGQKPITDYVHETGFRKAESKHEGPRFL